MRHTGRGRAVVLVSAAVEFFDLREWTRERLDALLAEPRDADVDWRRFEIIDGTLLVSPSAHPRHEAIVVRLGAALLTAAPAGHQVVAAAGIDLGRSYLVTDLTVVASHVLDAAGPYVDPRDVLVAVEIESPSSITTDRVTKPAKYAAAGIPFYWRIETDPLRLIAYQLEGDVYAEVGCWSEDEIAHLDRPLTIDIAVASLLSS